MTPTLLPRTVRLSLPMADEPASPIPATRPLVWTDDPVTTATTIKAVHVNELRRAVDGRRTEAGLPAYAWTDDPVIRGITIIRAIHFLELRAAIQQVWTAAGLGRLPSWTAGSPPAAGRVVHASDLNDLRAQIGQVSSLPDFTHAQ
jgi:hypothetical protein